MAGRARAADRNQEDVSQTHFAGKQSEESSVTRLGCFLNVNGKKISYLSSLNIW